MATRGHDGRTLKGWVHCVYCDSVHRLNEYDMVEAFDCAWVMEESTYREEPPRRFVHYKLRTFAPGAS